jgi:hypothetical protein
VLTPHCKDFSTQKNLQALSTPRATGAALNAVAAVAASLS